MYIGLHVKYRLLWSDFNKTLLLSIDFSKNTQITNCIKIPPVIEFTMWTDGRTDGLTGMTNLMISMASSNNQRDAA